MKMEENYRIEMRRVYLLRDLPAPLTRASSHLQIFDNYIENTRLRLRSIRSPETKEWKWILEQRFPVSAEDLTHWNVSKIYLNETEHAVFETFEGREISKNERVETNEVRKNRYFYQFNEHQIEIDVFLGSLWGLNLAKVYFNDSEELNSFDAPPITVLEATHNEFFIGENLIGKSFADVQREFKRMSAVWTKN